MYTFVTSHCLSRSVASSWKQIDISKSLLSTVFTTFRRVYLIVHNAVENIDVIVDLDSFRNKYAGLNITIENMLNMHAGLPLETMPELPNMEVSYARYMIGHKAGYKFQIVKAGYNYTTPQTSEYLPDLKITRPDYNTDMAELQDYCLTTVNGIIHSTETDGQALYVYDGAKSMRIANDNRFGFLSFLDIGKLTKTHIARDHIHPENPELSLKDKLVFSVSEEVGDRAYFLVLGGYIVFPENGIFWRTGANSFTLDINRIPYAERIMETREFTDISDMGLTSFNVSEDAVDMQELFSDEIIRNYLSLKNTFLVSIDTKVLNIEKFALRANNIPGQFLISQDPYVPLFVRNGRMVEYWSHKQDDTYVVSVPDAYYRNYALTYRDKTGNRIVDDSLMAQNPIYHSGALFLELSSNKR